MNPENLGSTFIANLSENYILSVSATKQAKDHFEFFEDIPPIIQRPHQASFIQIEQLLASTYDLPFLTLQSIHITQALLHVMISVESTSSATTLSDEYNETCERLRDYADNLQDLFEDINSSINLAILDPPLYQWQHELDKIFANLCFECIGGKEVKHSQHTLLSLRHIDWRQDHSRTTEKVSSDVLHSGNAVENTIPESESSDMSKDGQQNESKHDDRGNSHRDNPGLEDRPEDLVDEVSSGVSNNTTHSTQRWKCTSDELSIEIYAGRGGAVDVGQFQPLAVISSPIGQFPPSRQAMQLNTATSATAYTPPPRESTHPSITTTTSSRITPSIHAVGTRRSTDSRIPEEVLQDGDEIGPGLTILGQPISVVNARIDNLPTLRVIRKLGTGSYAVVYLVQEMLPISESSSDELYSDTFSDIRGVEPLRVGGKYYALKCLAKHAQEQDAQLLEATIHQSLPVHPNLVTLWTTLETASYLLLVLDYVPGEDLFYFLEQARDYVDTSSPSNGTPLTPTMLASLHPEQMLSHRRLKLIASMFSQMCDALTHCHRNGIYHRDVKPENFMITDGWVVNERTGENERKVQVKLTDFGLATRDAESGDMDCGSAPYMSYECHNNITPTYATAPADVWSLGIVLINILYHGNPWLSTAAGHCQSFESFLQDPRSFFMEKFPGMTPAVAEFFSRRVFCILESPLTPVIPPPGQPRLGFVGRRITGEEFGTWAHDLHLHLGTAARRIRPETIGTSELESEDEDSLLARIDPSSKRRKRAPRASSRKGQLSAQQYLPSTPVIESTEAALYKASILAEKSRMVAREASAMNAGHGLSTPHATLTPVFVPSPVPADVPKQLPILSTKHSIPELRKKKSTKWGQIFKRDSGSDQEVPGLDEISPIEPKYIKPDETAQQVSNVIMGLVPTNPLVLDDGFRFANDTGQSSSMLVRGRREERNHNDGRNDDRDVSPDFLMSVSTSSIGSSWNKGKSTPSSAPGEGNGNERRRRGESPAQSALSHFNKLLPDTAPSNTPITPVPTMPKSLRGAAPVEVHEIPLSPPPEANYSYAPSNRRSYAPSIFSVATASTSSTAFSAVSVSTAATSLSSKSWRNGGQMPPLPRMNIKDMDGVPTGLKDLPRQARHKPDNYVWRDGGPSTKSKNGVRSAPASPLPGSSFGLEPIAEKPKSSMKPPRTARERGIDALHSVGVIGDRRGSAYLGGDMGAFEQNPKSFSAGTETPMGLYIDADTYASGATEVMPAPAAPAKPKSKFWGVFRKERA